MNCHVGADVGTGLVHTIEVTLANTHDITVASKLIRLIRGYHAFWAFRSRLQGISGSFPAKSQQQYAELL